MAGRGHALLVAALVLALLLPGCITRERGPDRNGERTTLSYNGRDVGDHDADVWCDGSAELSAGLTLQSGRVEAVLEDADGRTVWNRTFDQRSVGDTAAVNGTAGLWTVRATRTATQGLQPFEGSYGITVAC